MYPLSLGNARHMTGLGDWLLERTVFLAGLERTRFGAKNPVYLFGLDVG